MEHYIRDKGFTGTGNMAMHRRVFDQVGPFAGIGVAEDRDWGQRATALGLQITWSPFARVYHPARGSFAEIARKWRRMTAHEGVSGGLYALALLLSPLAHLPRLLRSSRIPGGVMGRSKAFAGLIVIRWYRAWLALRRAPRTAEHSWRLPTTAPD